MPRAAAGRAGVPLLLLALALAPTPRLAAQTDEPPSHGDQGGRDQTDHGARDDHGGVGFGVTFDLSQLGHGRPQSRLTLYRELADTPDGPGAPSDFMYADLEVRGRGFAGYLNLSADGVWVIRNVPVTVGAASQWIEFSPGPLPPESGPIRYGYALDPTLRDGPPRETVSVTPGILEGPKCGLGGGGPKGGAGGSGLTQTGDQLKDKMHVHTGTFPNQPAKVNQCLSVAFSNSLKWLDDTQHLGLAAADITPDGVDAVVGRKEGKPADYVSSIKAKTAKFKAKIDTFTYDDTGITHLPSAIDKGCDVELMANPTNGGTGHVVSVTGIGQQKNGKWQINIAEDLKQGPVTGNAATDAQNHQTVSETITYPTGSHQIGGPNTGVDGYTITYFVVECKKGTAFD